MRAVMIVVVAPYQSPKNYALQLLLCGRVAGFWEKPQ